jgi:hypothetical protein
MPDVVGRRLRHRFDERRGRDDLPGRAEAALERVGADERIDERVVGETFDRSHRAVADRVGERDAGEDQDAVELNRAGAAVALAASDLGAGEAEVEPQDLGEGALDRRVQPAAVTVDGESELRQRPAPGIAGGRWPLARCQCRSSYLLVLVTPATLRQGCPPGG